MSPEHVPPHLGRGPLQVLSTPHLVGLLEMAAHRALQPHLGQGQTSVGTWLEIRHLAPVPLGWEVVARATVLSVEGNRVTFALEAHDRLETVAQGRHERAVVDIERLARRLQAKDPGDRSAPTAAASAGEEE